MTRIVNTDDPEYDPDPPREKHCRPRLATLDTIAAAVADLAAHSHPISARGVRAWLGGGSLETINRHLKALRGQGGAPGMALVRHWPADLPEALRRAHIDTPAKLWMIGGKKRFVVDYYRLFEIYPSGFDSFSRLWNRTIGRLVPDDTWAKGPHGTRLVAISAVHAFVLNGMIYHPSDPWKTVRLAEYLEWVSANSRIYRDWLLM